MKGFMQRRGSAGAGRSRMGGSVVVGSSRGRMNAKSEHEFLRGRLSECAVPIDAVEVEDEVLSEDCEEVLEAEVEVPAEVVDAEVVIDGAPDEVVASGEDVVEEVVADSPLPELSDVEVPVEVLSDGVAEYEPVMPGDPEDELEGVKLSFAFSGEGVAVLAPVTGGVGCEPREVVYDSGDGSVRPVELPAVFQDEVMPISPDESGPRLYGSPAGVEPVVDTTEGV